MEAYIILKNNEEEYEDYSEWIFEVYIEKEKAEKRFIELIKTNKEETDRTIRKARYNENIGAYCLEKHKIIE